MKPIAWIVQWINPKTGNVDQAMYYQRAAARGSAIMLRAQGMSDVQVIPQNTR